MVYVHLLCVFCLLVPAAYAEQVVPETEAHSLDGRLIRFPADLKRSTVLILGFTRNSADKTTAWDKALRSEAVASPSSIYDIAVLAGVPQIVRAFVVKSIRKEVPPVAQPNFLTVFDHEAEWKHAVQFDGDAPDAAYVLLVDRNGNLQWQTHEALSPERLATLRRVWSGNH